MGILVNTGFDVGSSNPIDSRTVKNTTDERDELVTDGLVYENLKVYCKDTQTEYRWTGTEWEEVGSGGTVDLSEYTKTYTSLSQLGLTAPITVGEIFNAMPDKTTAIISCEEIEENTKGDIIYVSDVPTAFGILTIKKNALNRFSIEYQNSLGGTVCNVRRWIGTLKGLDGTGLIWKEILTDEGVVITEDMIAYYGTEILKYPVGTWRINNINIGNQFTDLPLKNMGAVIEIDSIDPNRSPYENSYGYRNYIFKSSLDGIIYIRTLNSGGIAGTLQRDTGWKKVCTDDTRVTTLETQVSELFQSVSNGKTLVANAITGKGVSTSSTATFATMATNIGKIGGSKEETKSYNNTSAGISPITLTFSANVLGIKQVIPPSDMAYITPQTSANMFRIEGKSITIYVTGSGTWKVTALIKA